MNSPLRIGFDFHGVIADHRTALVRLAFNKYGKRIPAKHLTSKSQNRPISDDEYARIQELACASETYVPRYVNEQPGAIETLKKLRGDGHFVFIVTSSSLYASVTAIQTWLRQKKLEEIPFVNAGRSNTKEQFVSGFDVFVDDTPQQLLALKGHVDQLFLFHHETNEDFDEKREGMIRVHTHEEIYQCISLFTEMRPSLASIA